MKTDRWVALAVTVALAIPSSALAASATDAPSQTQAQSAGSARELLHQMVAAYERAIGAPSGALRARRDPDSAGFVFPALDMNDDGHADLLGVKIDYRQEISYIEGLDGRTGKTLFERKVDGYAFPAVARVGESATPGMLLLSFTYEGASALVAGAALLETVITAVDGAGNTVWERILGGVAADSLVFYIVRDYPLGAWTFNGIEGRATDVVLYMGEEFWGPTGGDWSWRRLFIDGRDGSTAYEQTSEEQGRSSVFGVSDLDGDGLDDIMRVGRANRRPFVEALKGTNGESIWGPRTLSHRGFPADLGDLSGDGVSELLVSGGYYCAYIGTDGYCGSSGRSSSATLVDGAKGKALWTIRAGGVHPIGDVNRDGGRDIGFQTTHSRGNKVGVTYSAVDWKGNELYSRFYGATGETEPLFNKFRSFANVGDIDGDGVQDSYHSLAFVDFETESFFSDEGYVSGRDGTRLREGELLSPLGASLDGKGDDLIRVQRGTTRHTLKIFDGRDGEAFWEKSLPVLRKGTRVYVRPISDGKGGVDLLVNLITYGRGDFFAAYLLDGEDGDIIWSRG